MTFDSTFQKPYGLPQEPIVSVKNSVFDVVYGQASERRRLEEHLSKANRFGSQ